MRASRSGFGPWPDELALPPAGGGKNEKLGLTRMARPELVTLWSPMIWADDSRIVSGNPAPPRPGPGVGGMKRGLARGMMTVLDAASPRKEVSHGPVYRAEAPLPDPPAPTTRRGTARTRPRPHPPRGRGAPGPQGRRGLLEARLLHPVADLPGLLLAGPQPGPLLSRRGQAGRRLVGAPGSEARRRGHQPVLQGPGAAARSGPVPTDALAGPQAARGGARGGELVWPSRQGGRRHHREHARHRSQPGGVPAEPVAEAGAGLPDRAGRGRVLPGHRGGARGGDRPVPGEADRRECPVSPALGRV